MSKKVRIVFGILLVSMLGAVSYEALQTHDPVYHGKPLSYWLRSFDFQRSVSTNDFIVATVAIRAMGTNALPILMERLQYKDSAFKIKLMRFMRKHPIVRLRLTPDYMIRGQAVMAIAAMREKAKGVLPELIEISKGKDENIAGNALLAMHYMGPEAVEPLTSALTNEDSVIRIIAVSELSGTPSLSLPGERKVIFAAVSKLLNDPDQNVRSIATNALYKIDPEAAAIR